METVLGSSLGVFIAMTVILCGFCAYMTGQALAQSWRPQWQLYPYVALIGAADRFLVYGLFDGELLALLPYLTSTIVLLVIALISFRLNQVDRMLTQYPWLYERDGLFGWKDRAEGDEIV